MSFIHAHWIVTSCSPLLVWGVWLYYIFFTISLTRLIKIPTSVFPNLPTCRPIACSRYIRVSRSSQSSDFFLILQMWCGVFQVYDTVKVFFRVHDVACSGVWHGVPVQTVCFSFCYRFAFVSCKSRRYFWHVGYPLCFALGRIAR